MVTGICVLLGAVLAWVFVHRRARRAAERARAGQAVTFPVGAGLPEVSRRWSPGRVRADADAFRWEPRWPWTRLRELPAGLRFVRARPQQGLEFL